MALVPTEFVGMARARRAALMAEHRRAVVAIDRIIVPLRGRFYLRQAPTVGCFAKVARTWRSQVPTIGRLDLSITHTPERLAIVEFRAGDCRLSLAAWDEGADEAAIEVSRVVLTISPGWFYFEHLPVASISLHALARRFQHGWHNSDAAICADLLALARPHADMPAREGDFTVLAADGQWAGFVTEIEDRGKLVPLRIARTWLPPPMTARTRTPAGAAMAPSGAGDVP
jgi:hypothetical protein